MRSVQLCAFLTVLTLSPPAFASINFVSSSTAMTNPNSGDASVNLTIPRPDDVEVGDFMLAQITFEKGSDANITSITQVDCNCPSGWTLIRRTNRSSDIAQAIYYKAATSADVSASSYRWLFSQSVKAAGGIICYEGVDADAPVVNSSGNSGDSHTLTALSINALKDSVLVAFFGFKKKDTTLSVPTDMEGIYNFQNPQDVTIRAADEVRTEDGATGNRVSTPSPSNSDKWVAQLVALRCADTNQPPVADAGPDQCVPSDPFPDDPDDRTLVLLDGSGSFDPDDDELEFKWSVSEESGVEILDPFKEKTFALFPIGCHEVTLIVHDLNDSGERKGTFGVNSVKIKVFDDPGDDPGDDSPPDVVLTTDLAVLWPPNHKMVPVQVLVAAPDGLPLKCFVASNQPDDSHGSGKLVGDVHGSDGFSNWVEIELQYDEDTELYGAVVFLRAERDGTSKVSRVYSIAVGQNDEDEEFETFASTVVVVPHDQGKKE